MTATATTKTTSTLLAAGLLVACGGGLREIDMSQPAKEGAVSLRTSFSPDPARREGHAEGSRDSSAFGETDTGPCDGWIGQRADYYLTLEDRFDFLRVEVASEADTSLVIEGPDGRFCSADQSAENPNPRVQGYFREGTYAIWVGTPGRGEEADYEIYFSQRETR